jgi:hypothetical protein
MITSTRGEYAGRYFVTTFTCMKSKIIKAFYLLSLPAVTTHELCHFFMAKVIGIKGVELTINYHFIDRNDDFDISGSVKYATGNRLKTILVSFAPSLFWFFAYIYALHSTNWPVIIYLCLFSPQFLMSIGDFKIIKLLLNGEKNGLDGNSLQKTASETDKLWYALQMTATAYSAMMISYFTI